MTSDVTHFDIAVIGAGVVGAAVARELAGYELSVVLIEARDDVGDATSKANTAILHTGFDAVPGSLESRLVARGYELLGAYADVVGIPVERVGAVLVAWTDEELAALPGLAEKAAKNGYTKCELIDAELLRTLVPALGEGVLGGLTVPDESIICPFTTPLAFATEAVARGVSILRNTRVESVEIDAQETVLHTTHGKLSSRWVVNAAGLGADVIDGLFGYQRFTVTPRRGELIVFDKLARPLAPKIVLPVPSSKGKGVLVAPTTFGNVMLGPTAEDLTDRTDTATTEHGFEFLLEKGDRIMPVLLDEEVTATYAGLRAATDHLDYVIEADAQQRYLLLGGIRSTGLTASMAIAEHARDLLKDAGLRLVPRAELPEPQRMPNIGEAFTRPYQDDAQIRRNAAYGEIVCFCERTTRGEIADALRSPVPPVSVEGIRRRTRATLGRCQGFYCGAEVRAMLRGDQHD